MFSLIFALFSFLPALSSTDGYFDTIGTQSCLKGALSSIVHLTQWMTRTDDGASLDEYNSSDSEDDDEGSNYALLPSTTKDHPLCSHIIANFRNTPLGAPTPCGGFEDNPLIITKLLASHLSALAHFTQHLMPNTIYDQRAVINAAHHTLHYLKSSHRLKPISFGRQYVEGMLNFVHNTPIMIALRTEILCEALALLLNHTKISHLLVDCHIDKKLFFPKGFTLYSTPPVKEYIPLNILPLQPILAKHASLLSMLYILLPNHIFACVALQHMLIREPNAMRKMTGLDKILEKNILKIPEPILIDNFCVFTSCPIPRSAQQRHTGVTTKIRAMLHKCTQLHEDTTH